MALQCDHCHEAIEEGDGWAIYALDQPYGEPRYRLHRDCILSLYQQTDRFAAIPLKHLKDLSHDG